MKAIILQENLARGLNIVSRAVSPRSTLPVLANVLLATDEGRLRLSATNLEMGITCWIGARIEEEGSTTVPARTFSDLVNALTGDQVAMSLDVNTQTLNVRCGPSNTDIKCIDAQEFPPLPALELDGAIRINVADFKEMVHQVAFAASTDEARPILQGVLIQVEGEQITLAAADGFRLSVRKANLSQPAAQSVNVIVPGRALNELARIISDGENELLMLVPKGRGQVIFRCGDVELVSQIIEGAYPDYQSIIPRSYQTRILVSTAAFLKACKQAEIFAREGINEARLNIKPASDPSLPGEVEVTASSEETGKSETVIEAAIEGKALLIAFNVKFLREALEVIKTPNVALEMNTSQTPGVIRPVGGEDFLHVIMPMRL
ncbi:MAG: DNA polymerase III subunit beta [Anaerolineales bacterium]